MKNVEEIERGNMPLKPYVNKHPEANLSNGDKEKLINRMKKYIVVEEE